MLYTDNHLQDEESNSQYEVLKKTSTQPVSLTIYKYLFTLLITSHYL
jgi:hypothetical protein